MFIRALSPILKIFLFASFRKVKAGQKMDELVKFQTQNKLLFMAYSQKHMRILGRIVANADKIPLNKVINEYEYNLREALKRNARFTSHINVLMHVLGYFKDDLKADEKKYFLMMLDRYKNEKIPLSVLLGILQSWIIRHKKSYLETQTYFNPYPHELVDITDSGKGRDK